MPKPEERHENELNDYGTDDPEELERKTEEDAEEAKKEFATEIKKNLTLINQLVEKHIQAIDKLTFESQVLDAAAEPIEDPNEDVSEEDDKDLKGMKATEKSVIQTIWEKAAEASKLKTVQFFMAALGIAGAVGAEKLIDYFEQLTKKKDAPPPEGMSKEDKEAFERAVENWSEMDDEQYWKSFAKFVKKHSSTMADLVFFMQYTVRLFPAKNAFLWRRSSDQSKLADTLVETYKDNEDLPMWVEDLPDQKYEDKPLPRSVTASVARLALTRMIDEKI